MHTLFGITLVLEITMHNDFWKSSIHLKVVELLNINEEA